MRICRGEVVGFVHKYSPVELHSRDMAFTDACQSSIFSG